MLEHHASQKNITFESKVSQSQFFTSVYGDERRYMQILVNFLSNSLKFSPRNSSIIIALEVKEHVLKQDIGNIKSALCSPRSPKSVRGKVSAFQGFMGAELNIENHKTHLVCFDMNITDKGCGISPENINKLFMDFSKMEESALLNKNGVGLGLSICKTLVEQMCGKVDV